MRSPPLAERDRVTRPSPDAALWRDVASVLARQPVSGRAAGAAPQLADALARGLEPALPAVEEADALLAIGNAMRSARRADLADGVFACAVRRAPHDPRLHNGWGVVCATTLRHPQAAGAFARARELAPNWLVPLVNEAEERTLLDEVDRSEALWRDAMRLAPDDPRPIAGLAMAIGQRGELDPALELARSAAAADPRNPRAWQVLGQLCEWAWRHDEALDAFRRMQALVPDSARAWAGIGAALLATGRWEEGFAALEHRRHGCHAPATRLPGVAVWTGEPLAGTLVLHADQGYGDMLMQARFIASIRPRVGRVVVLLEGYGASLTRTFEAVAGVDRVLVEDRALVDEAPAAVASLTSLAHHARATPPFDAHRIPYLRASEASRRAFDTLEASGPRPRVGVAWSVAARDEVPFVPRQKSLPPSIVAGWIAATPQVEWHSIQPGDAGDPALHGLDPGRVVSHATELRDFDATAALVERLDLVVSADTAVAHLAGALGKPVWLVDRANADWRFRPSAESTPWYPTMRIFRQQKMRDWSHPALAVERALVERYARA